MSVKEKEVLTSVLDDYDIPNPSSHNKTGDIAKGWVGEKDASGSFLASGCSWSFVFLVSPKVRPSRLSQSPSINSLAWSFEIVYPSGLSILSTLLVSSPRSDSL